LHVLLDVHGASLFCRKVDYSHRLRASVNGTSAKEYTLSSIPLLPVPTMKKLILPAEVKVCATCSYWDGERDVDTDLRLVMVSDDCAGECLVQSKSSPGLNDVRREIDGCLWEHLAPDSVPDSASDDAEKGSRS
jgi:hypothetical protein